MHPEFPNLYSPRAAGDAQTAGTSTFTGPVIDTQGFDEVTFITRIPTAAANNFVCIQDGNQANLSDAADVAGTRVNAAANGDLVQTCLNKPLKRYCRVAIVRGTSTATTDVLAVVGNKQRSPAVNPANVRTRIAASAPNGTP
jgi:hypothetical protein